MQVSKKQKNFLHVFFTFSKSLLNFKPFPKKDDRHS